MQITAPARWGVLIYSSATPDIEKPAVASIDEVLAAAPSDDVRVAAQLGTGQSVCRFCGGAEETVAELGWRAAPMSAPGTLEDFLRWGMKAVPAQRYMVVLGGHGSGFMGAVTDSTRQQIMHPQEMREALQAVGMHADVLVLNACLEANAEVALEVSPQADFLVASQGLQAGTGMALGRAVAQLKADTTPLQAARLLVDASATVPERIPQISALDESRLPAMVDRLDRLGDALLSQPGALDAAREVAAGMRNFREDKPWDRPLVDLKDVREFARRLDQALPGTCVADAARAVDEAAGRVVVASSAQESGGGRRSDAHGISLYLPTAPLRIDIAQAQYDHLALARATRWHEAVACLSLPAPR